MKCNIFNLCIPNVWPCLKQLLNSSRWTFDHSEFVLLSCTRSNFVITPLQMDCWRDARKRQIIASERECYLPFISCSHSLALFISFCPFAFLASTIPWSAHQFIYKSMCNVTDAEGPYLPQERALPFLPCWPLFKHAFHYLSCVSNAESPLNIKMINIKSKLSLLYIKIMFDAT